MILVLGSVVCREARMVEALELSQAHVARSRTEPGCLAHAVLQDVANPSRLVFVEQWVSQEALWEHFKVPASGAFVRALAAMATEEPRMAVYDATQIPIPRYGRE
jgi:quinol monooxygenase YgiN